MPAPETFYDVAMRRLDLQIQEIDALDAKGSTLTTAAGVLLPVFGALFAGFRSHPTLPAAIAYGLAFAVYLWMVFELVRGTRVKAWSTRPDLETLAKHAATHNESTVKNWVAREATASVSKNVPGVEGKAVAVGHASVGLVGVAVLLVVAALLEL
jgi:hypothetical protein